MGDYKVIHHEVNGECQMIKWQYIEALNTIQDIGLSFANKLKQKHIIRRKHKMNVKMAAQTLSSSTASAIYFLREDMDIPDFQGSKATTVFIRCIDELFDLLNSRNPFGKGNKAPITKVNLLQFMGKCEDLSRYIFNLKDECGRFLQNDRRKIVLWGFAFTL